MNLTTQQTNLIRQLSSLVISQQIDLLIVGGYAGTGKTSVICELRKKLDKAYKVRKYFSVSFVTFTGKASSVLKSKLINNKIFFKNDYCGTIHGLIYKPKRVWDNDVNDYIIIEWERKEKGEIETDLIIIDEASMVSKEILDDLRSFHIPIIAFGDHGQLPPISKNHFNLMTKPDFFLTKIHRQKLNSPIIKLSKFIRKAGYIPHGFYSSSVIKGEWSDKTIQKIWNEKIQYDNNELIILCGFNSTRVTINEQIRKKLEFDAHKLPFPSEKIVCLANNHDIKIMNGQIGTLLWTMPEKWDMYRAVIDIDNEMYECLMSIKCFGEAQHTLYSTDKKSKQKFHYAVKKGYHKIDYFDYGYAISVHKSQGSEWDKVVLFEQRFSGWDDEYYAKWLYTAVTRSKEKLFIINNFWG